MMNKIHNLLFILFLFSIQVFSQSNELSNSPYSYYGLGLTNKLGPGKNNALGKAGIALSSSEGINLLNPASLAKIPLNHFFYDIGLRYKESYLTQSGRTESKNSGNFSSIAIAFAISEKSGLGVSLLPYTNVGYSIYGIETAIEGTERQFHTKIEGSGGLNDFNINFGTSISEKLRLGIKGSVIFGKINEDELNLIGTSAVVVKEVNNYVGGRLELGVQYDWKENLTAGIVINSPSELFGGQVQGYSYIYEGQNLGASHDLELQSFYLPLEIGIGIETGIGKKTMAYLDYKRNFWTQTDQSDKLGDYVDQDLLGVGLEYSPGGNPLKYSSLIKLRGGFEYDTGNLKINDEKVENYAISLGIGLPINRSRKSMLNLHYSYGQQGTLSTTLVRERFHLLSLNLSLQDLWFIKFKYD
ncbi:hypothetical protein [Christiangramia crocea]|uniref:Long-chain fatty acid transport protein n=1 Tax=Christiangramia crocea TaxID=2904124 RepID=A0A9X2A7K7_9FLAO|nr:hypothetical protein [Gramella crocea]MCG9970893.1 hypothetical protein [Gramella crocea]